jgi:Tol biopolymer transport system component
MIACVLLVAFSASAPAGSIAFLAETDQGSAVHLATIKTGTVERIGPGEQDGRPFWSPDGRMVAFTTRHDSQPAIAVWSADEERLIVLGAAEPASNRLCWSPDSTRLAYEDAASPDWRIGVVSVETGEAAIWGGGATGLVSPVWIADRELLRKLLSDKQDLSVGTKTSVLDEEEMLLATEWMPPDTPPTTDPVLLTPNARLATSKSVLPSATPHAEWGMTVYPRTHSIAYESDDGGDREIFAFSARRGVICLSNNRAADWNPVWSPSGFWVLFESFRSGRRGLYRAHRETARVEIVRTIDNASCWEGTWSPSSEWVAFTSDFDGVPHIWITSANGKGDLRRLTIADEAEGAPAWRPNVR